MLIKVCKCSVFYGSGWTLGLGLQYFFSKPWCSSDQLQTLESTSVWHLMMKVYGDHHRSLNVRDCLVRANIFIPGSRRCIQMIHCPWFLSSVKNEQHVKTQNVWGLSIEKLFYKTVLDLYNWEMSYITFQLWLTKPNQKRQRNKTTDYWTMSHKYEGWLNGFRKTGLTVHIWHSVP